ncbi:uncharacterized protein A4U43_C02F6910 [Asparagus officinalis]|uniref:RING-type domain-containing protein n=1 Tax=Asparagus officinalis TaxID=4686 RepID=A0A5P1FHD0_ASPOF|nr:receptor homology region, transmembrane domain- and RING domain-containing protein 2-like [Asparagus officinalis]ONK77474.1 uncharacterized protein A4U43_C02F6910 [Asparagus officinalis]
MALLIRVYVLLIQLLVVGFVTGNVVLMGNNISMSFDDMEANFTPKIKGSVENGVLYLADPIDACSPLKNRVVEGSNSPFALIIRGICSFDDKVRNAQNAGYKAAIIYDCEDGFPLVEMRGAQDGIKIYAVFISKASGKILKEYAGRSDVETWILPDSENRPWSAMTVSFLSLLAMVFVMATCLHGHNAVRERFIAPQLQEFHGMSGSLVKAMPSVRFTCALEDNCTSSTCAICLEDYSTGERLRILPCRHMFHAICVDSWLTSWRTFCPVCKRDARTNINIPPASESTPLLYSDSQSSSSSIPISSLAKSLHTPVVLSPSSLCTTHHMASSYRSYNISPDLCMNINFSGQRNICGMSHHISPHSIGLSLPSSYSSSSSRGYNSS